MTVGVICNMWFYFILHHFGNSLGSVYICVYICYYYYFSIPLLDLCSWIPFSSFIFLEVVQNTFGEVNETICNFFFVCFFFSLWEVIQSHLKAIETLRGCRLGSWWEWFDISIYEITKSKWDVISQNPVVLICSCVFQHATWLALGAVGQSSILVLETL